MEINLSQSLKQEQILSPQMLQSLALLTLPVQELKTHIQEEIEKNPALEIPEGEFEAPPVAKNALNSTEDETLNAPDAAPYELSSFSYTDYEASDRKQEMLENTSVFGESLNEHLLSQLGETNTNDTVAEISEMLIGNLDENGFFILPLDKLFEEKAYRQEDIDSALSLVQSFDPYGICASDFRESLVIQARASGMDEEDLKIFTDLVYNYLEKLNSGKTAEVAHALKISEEDLQTFYSILKSFTPYPGRNYSRVAETYVVPEFSIRNRGGRLVLTLNRDSMPDLEISDSFVKLADSLSGDEAKEASRYISTSVSEAKLLIKQVQLRYQTIYKAAIALMEAQHDFFTDGPRYLKTLSLKEIGDKIGVHETTMSRLSQSKWVETDWGLFPLKYFFSQGVATDSGESVSRNAVKDMIAEIIAENPKLSDQKISDRLKEKGISCARRTVSKYRSELNINSSFSRN
ncbi:MAG: RNA polymerase factor sigma-54 [Sphaerochaetaceae bacterium]|nr:RNA polymerase factor sigma-54 [Sphaerochaetaceae bacterium]